MGFDLFAEHVDLALPGGPVRRYVAGPVDAPPVVLCARGGLTIAGAGHLASLGHPVELGRIVRDFLAGRPVASV